MCGVTTKPFAIWYNISKDGWGHVGVPMDAGQDRSTYLL